VPGEFDFIDWLGRQPLPSPQRIERIAVGVGDDLAALTWTQEDGLLLVGVDQVMDGVHFDSAVHTPRAIGRKAMNRNLSDCAAMACLPAAAVATLCLPTGVGVDYAKELFLGMQEAAGVYHCPVVGGDTGSWPGKLVVTVTILGRSAGVTPVTRTGARPGDRIYVTGPLGGSIKGRHMTFSPRVDLARDLAKNHRITAMADLSDGLLRDLRNICLASRVGARLAAGRIPVHPDVGAADRDAGLVAAVSDGEDYELVLTSPDMLGPPCVDVGTVTDAPHLSIETGKAEVTMAFDEIGGGGWEHDL